jgi:hypothetical protein
MKLALRNGRPRVTSAAAEVKVIRELTAPQIAAQINTSEFK